MGCIRCQKSIRQKCNAARKKKPIPCLADVLVRCDEIAVDGGVTNKDQSLVIVKEEAWGTLEEILVLAVH